MKNNDLVVVGIGSSAGGLEALQIMLSSLPDIPNCAYVIVQHLSPTHKSMMVELLTRITNIPVIEVKNGMVIKAKTIYMTPENTDIYVDSGKLFLKHIEQTFGPRPSVNYFFNSLANNYGYRSIGVILSGTGSDGAYGIRSIKAEGGITIAQSPTTAKYDGMPLSAINTGKVDLVVSIDNLSQEVASIVDKIDSGTSIETNEHNVQQIFRALFEEYGVDFSLYKKSTITRRLERRMAALKLDSVKDYFEKFIESKEEISNLYHDILIGVTEFFRDKEAFGILKEQIKHIISKKEQGEEIRLWSIGCSTGEEAYSIAILISEILQEKIDKYRIKIFATDIDDESLKIARNGVYAETALQGLDSSLLQRYFSVQKNQYEVKKKLRELVIFSRHNVVTDSPFLRLDLVSCRNMLIYFSQSLQNKFFPIIHYALNDNGTLFLGKSESIGSHIDLFNLIDKNAKIFKAQYTGIKEPPKLYNYSSSLKNYDEPRLKKTKNDGELFEEKIVEAIQMAVLDKCAVINSSNDMIYIKGKIPFLNHSDGRVSNNIFKLIESDLSLDLRSAINEANKTKKAQKTTFRPINIFDDLIQYVRITVVPIIDDRNEDWFNVLFFQNEETQSLRGHIVAEGNESDIIDKLTIELDSTKSHLQNVIEELETSYEEMQSLNEELQSSNEELQSSNEELETTNEELQSTNEELQTAYSELRILYDDKDKRTKQLESLMEKLNTKTEDLRHEKDIKEAILDTTPIAVTMVDNNGQIIYANKSAEILFQLEKSSITSRVYNAPEWKIKKFNGEKFDESYLPFNVIKRTFAPVYDIHHTIEIDGSVKYLSVSGGPLFDPQGIFQGAVFSIEDRSVSELSSDKSDKRFKESPINEIVSSTKDDLMSLFIIDTISTLKDEINQIAILNQLDNKADPAKKKIKIGSKIEHLNHLLNEKLDLYRKNNIYENRSILESFEYYKTLFRSVMESSNINFQIESKLKNKDFSTLEYDFRAFYYNFFEFILSISDIISIDKKINIMCSIEQNKDSLRFGLVFDQDLVEKKLLSEKFLILEKNIKQDGIEFDFINDKEIRINIIFGLKKNNG